MIFKARYARLANAQAPRQEKAAYAAQRIRALAGPSLRLWLDGAHDPAPVGMAVPAASDRSGRNVQIAQFTAARQPLRSSVAGVAGWTFDGTDDRLECGNIDLSGSNKATVLVVNRYAVAGSTGMLFEVADNSAVHAGGIQLYRYNAAARFSGGSHSGASYNARYIAGSAATWVCHGSTFDRSLAAASETVLYANGAVVASTAIATVDLSANFENRSGMIGGWSFSAATLNGQIAQVLVLTGALSAAQMQELSVLLLQLSGVA